MKVEMYIITVDGGGFSLVFQCRLLLILLYRENCVGI